MSDDFSEPSPLKTSSFSALRFSPAFLNKSTIFFDLTVFHVILRIMRHDANIFSY